MRRHQNDQTDVGAQHIVRLGTGCNAELWRRMLRIAGIMRIAGGLLRGLTRFRSVKQEAQ